MKGYVDLYLLAVPKKNLAAYRQIARRFGEIVADYGALEYREFLADELKSKFSPGFDKLLKLKPGEVMIFSAVEFRSKKHRNDVNKKAFHDPRMQEMAKMKPLFDKKRIHYAGFATFVKMSPR